VDAAPLQITTSVLDGVRHVAVTGEIDAQTASLFQRGVLAALDGAHGLELDLRGVTFCDSAGLASLVQISQTARRGAVHVGLLASSTIDDLFRLTGLSDLFAVAG
jgi:anti-sigma B factor antagonist